MALQTAQGMAYLHNQHNRIIHRDLKSHNLLVCENFDIKVGECFDAATCGGGTCGADHFWDLF